MLQKAQVTNGATMSFSSLVCPKEYRCGLLLRGILLGAWVAAVLVALLLFLGVSVDKTGQVGGVALVGVASLIYGLGSSQQANHWAYLDTIVKYWHKLISEAAKDHPLLLNGDGSSWDAVPAEDQIRCTIHNQLCVDCMSIIIDYVQSLPAPHADELNRAWSANFRAYLLTPVVTRLWREDAFAVRSSMRPSVRDYIESVLAATDGS